jgi:LysM repeat protein
MTRSAHLKAFVSVFVLVSMTLLLLFTVQTTSAAACSQYHLVQRGENLFRLALRYGTTVAALQQANGLGSSTLIFAGQQLCVRMDGGNNPGGTPYIVQPGDTLGRIARRYGVNMNVLARVNAIVNPNLIYAGQTLIIPDVTIQ